MPCYPCTHCNKCGIYSIRLELTCATCGSDVVVGLSACPNCGDPYAHNTIRGKMGKVDGSSDYYTKLEEFEKSGSDGHSPADATPNNSENDGAGA